MTMTKEEAAARLDGNQYREEGSRELFAAMKEAGLVAVFGASDDLMEFRGAIDDEIGAYDGTTAYLSPAGRLQNDCDNDRCPHFERAKETAPFIEAVWSPEAENMSWLYRTSIPHATFLIKEDDDTYCRGIVFALADVVQSE
jgi:hypothetical protein